MKKIQLTFNKKSISYFIENLFASILFVLLTCFSFNFSKSFMLDNLITPAFYSSLNSGENYLYGSVTFKNDTTNYTLNKNLPYDSVYILENTYNIEKNYTFLRIKGNNLIKPFVINNGYDIENEVVSFCKENYADLNFECITSGFTSQNAIYIPESLARTLSLSNENLGESIDFFSKYLNEKLNRSCKLIGIYKEDEKSSKLFNICGKYPIVVSRNTYLFGTPEIFFKSSNENYLYFNVYFKNVYNSIVVEDYETTYGYGYKSVKFFNSNFVEDNEINNLTNSREAFYRNQETGFYSNVFLVGGILTLVMVTIFDVKQRKKFTKQEILILQILTIIMALILLSVIGIIVPNVSIFGSLPLFNGLALVLSVFMLIVSSLIVVLKNEKNIIA